MNQSREIKSDYSDTRPEQDLIYQDPSISKTIQLAPQKKEQKLKNTQAPFKTSNVKKTSPGRIVMQKSLDRGTAQVTQVYGGVAIKSIDKRALSGNDNFPSDLMYRSATSGEDQRSGNHSMTQNPEIIRMRVGGGQISSISPENRSVGVVQGQGNMKTNRINISKQIKQIQEQQSEQQIKK